MFPALVKSSVRPHALLLGLVFAVVGGGMVMAGEPTDFALTIKDHKFSPTELVVPANVKLRLVVKNLDSSAEEFESYELNREKIIPGGSEGVIFIGPLDPDTYPFFGDFNQSTAQGKIIAK